MSTRCLWLWRIRTSSWRARSRRRIRSASSGSDISSDIRRSIAALDRVRDSYNVNGLGQIAAEATIDDLPYYRANIERIVRTRGVVTRELTALGFEVLPSQTNFVLARPPRFVGPRVARAAARAQILVRWFNAPDVRDYLRITIGTDAEARALCGRGKADSRLTLLTPPSR